MKNEINDIGNLFKDSFEGYATNPSPAVWKGIQSKLWLSNFLNFSIASFNIYYAAIIVAAITYTGFVVLDNKSEEATNNIEDVLYNAESDAEIKRWLLCDENPQRIEFKTQTQKTNTKQLSQKNKTADIENKKTIDNSTYINKDLTRQKEDITKLTTKTNKSISNSTIIKRNTKEIAINNSTLQNEKTIVKTSAKAKENNNSIKESNSINKRINYDETVVDDSKSIIQKKAIEINPDKNYKENDEDVYDTIYVTITDTIRYTDTINVYDTIPFYEPKKKHKKRSNNKFEGLSVDIFSGVQNTSFGYNSDIELLRNNLSTSSSPAMSFALGTNVNYEIDKWKIQTGITYMQLIEDFNYLEEISTIDTTGSFWEYHAVGFTHSFDTVGYEFQIDTLNGDTFFVYVPMIIDTITTVFDSAKIYSTETNNSIKSYNIRNKYTYLNIPIMFGYNFYENKKMILTGKLGGNIGILLNAKGTTFSLLDNKSIIDFNENSLPFLKTNFSWIAGLNMYYKIEKNMGVFVEPYFKGSLNSMFDKNHPVGLKANGIGLNIGFRFYL